MAHLGRMIKRFLSALALSILSVSSISAQQVTEKPIRGEILQGWQQADGTRIAALKLTLAPGWKTYWRSPGDTGIPPQFDWSKSSNLRSVGITWPAPYVYRDRGVTTIGYKDVLVLPFAITPVNPDAPTELWARVDLGVCKDVCIPHQMTLNAVIDDDSTIPTPAIAAALAARPLSAQEGRVSSAKCSLKPNSYGMEIRADVVMPSLGGREVVVIEPGLSDIWMSETDVSREGDQLTATGDLAAIDGGALVLEQSDITITVLGASQAVEIDGCQLG